MNLPHDTLVAVADGEKFHLYRTEGSHLPPHLRPAGQPHVESSNHSGGVHHKSGPSNPDEKQDAEDMFAAATAGFLNEQAMADRMEHAIVIAPPKMLGELRKHYHKTLASKLLKEIPKDLTGHSVDDIAAAIERA